MAAAAPAPADVGVGVEQVIRDFVAKLNASDAAGAEELMCAGGRGDESAVDALAAQKPSPQVSRAKAAIGPACVGSFTVS